MTELIKPDLVQQGLDRLPSVWEQKPKATGLLKAFLTAFQNPLDLIFEILNGTSLFDAQGVQLDILGKLWGVSRSSRTDEDFRADIYQAITNPTLDSTPERIYEVMKVASNATKLKLIEHITSVYLYLNIGIVERLKELAETTVAAGVDIKLVFPPIEDGKSVSSLTSWDYSLGTSYDLSAGVGSATTTLTTFPLSGVFGTAVIIEDADINDAPSVDFTHSSVSPELGSGSFRRLSFFLKKDVTATAVALVNWTQTGSVFSAYEFYVDPVTGGVEASSAANLTFLSTNVTLFDDSYYYIEVDVQLTVEDSTGTSTLTIYPAISTTLGGAWAVAPVGAITIAEVVDRVVSQATYNHITSESTGLRCSEVLLESYFLVDGVGDSIVDDVADFIKVNSGFIYLNGAEPLGELNNITLSQPCTEVI